MRPDRAVARACSGTTLPAQPYRPSWGQLFRRRAELAPEARRPGHSGAPWHSSTTLSARPGVPPAATPIDGPAATRVPAAVGSRTAYGSFPMAPSTRRRRSGLIKHSLRFTT